MRFWDWVAAILIISFAGACTTLVGMVACMLWPDPVSAIAFLIMAGTVVYMCWTVWDCRNESFYG